MAIRAPDGAKNSHILPTGQWYAPSAVINDALIIRYLALSITALHCLALYCTVLHRLALSCTVLHYTVINRVVHSVENS